MENKLSEVADSCNQAHLPRPHLMELSGGGYYGGGRLCATRLEDCRSSGAEKPCRSMLPLDAEQRSEAFPHSR